jgi:hypothetical protein
MVILCGGERGGLKDKRAAFRLRAHLDIRGRRGLAQ